MKILFVTPAPRAGSQQYTHQLANALVERGHEVMVATAIDFEMKPYPKGYRVWELFDGFRIRPLSMLRFLIDMRRMRLHVIHFVGAQQPAAYLGFSHILRYVSQAPFVFTPADVLPNICKRIDLWALPRLYRRMRHVFLNAEQNRKQVINRFAVDQAATTVIPIPDHLAFIRNSATPEFPALPAGRRLLLCFGLIEPRKGIPTLLEACARVKREVPEIYLIIAGKPYMDIKPLQQQIERLGIKASVMLIPRYLTFEEMAGQFSRAECIVLPYDRGWNSGVLATAFGYQKLVVTTNVGGFSEVIEDGETGLLVPPKDPAALANALVRILTDQKLRAHISAVVARTSAERTWEQLAKTSESVYNKIILSNEKVP
jgi:glycosyltransferase involved in cell wall biosynthesis